MKSRMLWLVPVFAGVLVLVVMMGLVARPVSSDEWGVDDTDLTLESHSPVYLAEPAHLAATWTGEVVVSNTQYFLPLAVRGYDPVPPFITNGGFEAGSFVGWGSGGVLPRAVVSSLFSGTVYAGTYSALLGDPSLGPGGTGDVPVGRAWISQTFTIPEDQTGTLLLAYRTQGWDGEGNDRFRACLTELEWGNGFCFYDTFEAPAGTFKDTGWVTVAMAINPEWQDVRLELEHWNEFDGYWNTWTYVDEVDVELKP